MKKLSGFSLMEMMVVLLIVSIVAAASAPMINKRMVTAATEKSPWVWVGANHSIAYNLGGSSTQTASIGTNLAPANAENAKLFIDSGSPTTPQLALGQDDTNIIKLLAGNTSVFLTDDITNFNANHYQTVLGYGAKVSDSANAAIAIGYKADAKAAYTTAIGLNATASGQSSTAIGLDTTANGQKSISMGYRSTSNGTASTAIGHIAITKASNSLALGYNATAYADDSTAIGYGSKACGKHSMAFGSDAIAENENSISIGSNATSTGANTIAIGYDAQGSSEDVVIGKGATSTRTTTDVNSGSVVIGRGAAATETDAIAIGSKVQATSGSAIAMGSTAHINTRGNVTTTASGAGAIAIGDGVEASKDNSMALGKGAYANHTNSTAIGYLAQTTAENQIVLGTANDTVYIPGNLVVAGNTVLGIDGSSHVWLNVSDNDGGNGIVQVGSGSAGNNILCAEKKKTNSGYGTTYELAKQWFSDRRLKNVGKVFEGGLAEIKKLEVFNYTFKADESKTPRVGVMAQDLQKIFPNAITKGEDGFLRIRMEDMFYALVNAVKELSNEFDTHDKQIAELTKQNKELQKTVTTLEKRLAELEKKVNTGK